MSIKISALQAITNAASGDVLPIVDVSDTTQAATGSTRKITTANLLLPVSLDTANNRVGINDTNPSATLDVGGDIYISPVGSELFLNSDNTGGADTSLSTSSIRLESHQQAISPNYFSEVLKLDINESDAKPLITWRDNFTSPGNPVSKAWLVTHYERAGAGGPPTHQHFSIETSKADGTLITRMEFPYDNDTCEIVTYNSNFTANSGTISVGGQAGNNRVFAFKTSSTNGDGVVTYSTRWSINANDTAEGGSNAGSDLKISRYADNGNYISSPMVIERSSGWIGVNIADPTDVAAQFDVLVSTDINAFHIKSTHAGASNAALMLAEADNVADKVWQSGLSTDTVKRINITAGGIIEWGPGGAAARDTNLFRDSANVLATNDNLLLESPATTARYIWLKARGTGDYSALLRMSGEDVADQYMGGYIQYDASANQYIIGVHNTNDTNTANDIEMILFDRDGTDIYLEADINIKDGENIILDTTTGTKIGTATNQKLGFFNAAPVIQQAGVAVTAAAIHAALVNLGLITA